MARRRRRISRRAKTRRAARAQERRIAAHLDADDLAPVIKARRLVSPTPEPPEGLTPEELDNWKFEQRVARRLAIAEAALEAWERGETTHVPRTDTLIMKRGER